MRLELLLIWIFSSQYFAISERNTHIQHFMLQLENAQPHIARIHTKFLKAENIFGLPWVFNWYAKIIKKNMQTIHNDFFDLTCKSFLLFQFFFSSLILILQSLCMKLRVTNLRLGHGVRAFWMRCSFVTHGLS